MFLIVSIIGLLASAVLILYIFDLFDKTKNQNIVRNEPKTPESLQRAIKKTLKENQQKEIEKRLRICPICGTILNQTDYLIAAFDEVKDPTKKRKVHIYGCPYCITNDGVLKTKGKIDPSQLG
jgi:uncharacterized protein with PIN domain